MARLLLGLSEPLLEGLWTEGEEPLVESVNGSLVMHHI
jgi:hypothetical protein